MKRFEFEEILSRSRLTLAVILAAWAILSFAGLGATARAQNALQILWQLFKITVLIVSALSLSHANEKIELLKARSQSMERIAAELQQGLTQNRSTSS